MARFMFDFAGRDSRLFVRKAKNVRRANGNVSGRFATDAESRWQVSSSCSHPPKRLETNTLAKSNYDLARVECEGWAAEMGEPASSERGINWKRQHQLRRTASNDGGVSLCRSDCREVFRRPNILAGDRFAVRCERVGASGDGR